VASAQQANHSDDAVALAHGCSQGSAHLPSSGPGAALFPGELTSSLPLSKGGVGLVHVPTQIQALQAKVISRLLEPERLAWKVFQLYHLSQASQVQPLGYGASILFSTLSTDQLQLPARLSAYVAAFRALHPHRLQPVTAMLPSDVMAQYFQYNNSLTTYDITDTIYRSRTRGNVVTGSTGRPAPLIQIPTEYDLLLLNTTLVSMFNSYV